VVLAECEARFRDDYDGRGYLATRPYDGAADALREMRAMGMQLHLVTNKRRLPTRRILEVLGWWGLFSSVNTLDSSAHATSKTDVVAGLLTESDIPKFSTRLVGDSLDDAIAARDNGIAFLWARWGYGRDPLLATMGASLDNIRHLVKLVSDLDDPADE
jgi:phosphoglycolate phosphatase